MASIIILDTNRGLRDGSRGTAKAVTAWYLRQRSSSLHTTSITVAEILFGLNLMPPGKRRDRVTQLYQALKHEFRGRFFAFDEAAAAYYGKVRGDRQRSGRACHRSMRKSQPSPFQLRRASPPET